MKEHPILFSGPMVRAILDGRKTQTRRVVTAMSVPAEVEPMPPVCVTNPHWRDWDSIFPDNYKIDTSLPSDKRPMTTAEIDRLTFFGFPEDTNPSAEPTEKGE